MPSYRFKFRLDGIEKIRKEIKDLELTVTQRDAKTIGVAARDLMLEMISSGQSPIHGKGKFPPYKRADDPDGYPNNMRSRFPNKKKTPVNLHLSGDFLDTLEVRTSGAASNPQIKIGFYDSLSKQKEQGHREGAKGQPKRPIIPNGKERFHDKIESLILTLFRQLVLKGVSKLKG